jgi:hypothetical protein
MWRLRLISAGWHKPGLQRGTLCRCGIDVDAVAGWLGSYDGEEAGTYETAASVRIPPDNNPAARVKVT